MTIDALLFQTLAPVVAGDAAYPDQVPEGIAAPYIVHQQVGGQGLMWTEGTLPENESVRVQVACWAATRDEATDLAKAAEVAILAQPGWQAEPLGGRTSTYDPDTGLRGSRQDFSIWAPR